MNKHILDAIGLIIVGCGLIAYAHANFASKSTVEKMDDRIYEIYKVVVEKKDVSHGKKED